LAGHAGAGVLSAAGSAAPPFTRRQRAARQPAHRAPASGVRSAVARATSVRDQLRALPRCGRDRNRGGLGLPEGPAERPAGGRHADGFRKRPVRGDHQWRRRHAVVPHPAHAGRAARGRPVCAVAWRVMTDAAEFAVGAAALSHIAVASLSVGSMMLAPAAETLGRTRPHYTEIAHTLARFTLVTYTTSLVLAVIMIELFIGLFPFTNTWLFNHFRGAIAVGAI